MVERGVVRVGTSGWQYDDWNMTFYPDAIPKSRWFEHYASRFSTVEINATFYRLPQPTTVEKWRDRAPAGFRFAIKGSRYLTHNKKLADPEEPVGNVVTRLSPLQATHGVWLWQLPPNLHRDVPRLERFLRALPARPRHAVEFRHVSWYTEEVEAVLRRRDVAWVWLSDHQLPDICPVTAGHVYLRLHGLSQHQDERYRWDYATAELEPWARRMREAADAGRDGWVYFNNDFEANAPRNALTMIDLLGEVARPWPHDTSAP